MSGLGSTVWCRGWVGSRVEVESARPYHQSPERWVGEVVRHARGQKAFAVRLSNGTIRFAAPLEASKART